MSTVRLTRRPTSLSPWSRALLLAVLLGPAVLALGGSIFEGTDGDLVSQGGVDWAELAASGRLLIGPDLPSGQGDDSLQGKEDDLAPGVEFGSIPNNKSDLLRFYLSHEAVEVGEGETADYLYLAWVRANTLGTANMDFEFNQADQLSANGRTPVRTEGDMLITFSFANGGNQVNLALSIWTELGPCEASPAAPCWGPLMALGAVAEGSVNFVDVLDPIAGTMLPAMTFGEAAINLTDAGVFDRDQCVSFGSAYVKSRSSDSFSASLKDFIRPIDISVTNCATITVRKDAVPNDAQAFAFRPSSELGAEDVLLADDGNETAGLPSRHSWVRRLSGPVTIDELPVSGWDLTGVSCTGASQVERDAEGAPTGRVTLDVPNGQAAECTYVNTKRGRIRIDQIVVPGGDPQPFSFTLTGGPDELGLAFALTGSDAPYDTGMVRPGVYSAVQQDDGPAWDLASATCSDGSSPNAIVLDPGETVTCTFTNVKRGTIRIDEVTVPAGDPKSFGFSLTGGPDAIAQSFTLTDASAPHTSGLVRSGVYSALQQDDGPEWDLSSATCSDGSPVAAVALDPGEVVTCTFVNTRRGTIRVDVVTNPSGDPQSFGFTLSGGPDAIAQSFSLTDASTPYASGFLRAGSYAVTAAPAGATWDLTSASCSDGSAPATVGLSAGETVTCTFVYVKRGTIRVDVVTDPAGDPQSFGFSLTGGPDAIAQTFSLSDVSVPYASGPLRMGTYAVTPAPAGAMWDLTSASCSDGSQPGAIGLGAGETVTCTFVYAKRARIHVRKIVTNEPPPGTTFDPTAYPFDFDASWGATFVLHHGESKSSDWITSRRSYSISEQAARGWYTTSECTLPGGSLVTGGSSISVTPPAGAEIYCTFYNELRLHPGSAGFWRNWSNHYTSAEFLAIVTASLSDSPIFALLFDPATGAPRGDILERIDAIFAANGTEAHLLREITSTFLNLGVSQVPQLEGYQNNDDICLECVLDLDALPAAEALLRDGAPCELASTLRIADAIAVAEGAWTGDLSAGEWSFGPLTEAQLSALDAVFNGINQGTTVVADVTRYPAELTCVTAAGPTTFTWYRDADGDGHGLLADRTQSCSATPPAGYSAEWPDCDDTDASVYPRAPEVCDGQGNDCFAPGWPSAQAEETDGDGDGLSECAGDCNDVDPTVRPGAPELCDGRATDCAGPAWPLAPAWDRDDDGDSRSECGGDCDDTRASVYPGAQQLCDGRNNNCSDPLWPAVPFAERDADADGAPACNDCADTNAARHPGATEACNGVDDDCNGLPDDDGTAIDPDGDGIAAACDNCPQLATTNLLDNDKDGVGNECDGCPLLFDPQQADLDLDGRGDACDSCPADADLPNEDLDADRIGDACDNCLLAPNGTQTDVDGDGEGDACDANDGMIYLRFTSHQTFEWDGEPGDDSWNCYRGDLAVLRSSGVYTQAPGSNSLAAQVGDMLQPQGVDSESFSPGRCAFYLITGIDGGVEGSLGQDSSGNERPNDNPIP